MTKSTSDSALAETIPVSTVWNQTQISTGSPLDLIDVRTPGEFAGSHVAGARSIPLNSLDAAKLRAERQTAAGVENDVAADHPLYVMCRSGHRSKQAVAQLRRQGLSWAIGVEGGLLAWAAAGYPVERGKEIGMSLERQVRIAAGALVLLGAVFGWWVHPGFFALSAFVGAGLVFAGATDTCALGLLLAKMPWN